MRPLKLKMQAFGSYGRETVIDFTKPEQNLFLIWEIQEREKQLFSMLLYLLCMEKQVPHPIKKKAWYFRVSMRN